MDNFDLIVAKNNVSLCARVHPKDFFQTLGRMRPSGLRRCSKNWKVPSSIPIRRSAGLRDPTLLRGSWWPSGQKCKTQWLRSGGEAAPR